MRGDLGIYRYGNYLISFLNSFRYVIGCICQEFDDKNKRGRKVVRKDIRIIEILIFFKIKDSDKRKEFMKKEIEKCQKVRKRKRKRESGGGDGEERSGENFILKFVKVILKIQIFQWVQGFVF